MYKLLGTCSRGLQSFYSHGPHHRRSN